MIYIVLPLIISGDVCTAMDCPTSFSHWLFIVVRVSPVSKPWSLMNFLRMLPVRCITKKWEVRNKKQEVKAGNYIFFTFHFPLLTSYFCIYSYCFLHCSRAKASGTDTNFLYSLLRMYPHPLYIRQEYTFCSVVRVTYIIPCNSFFSAHTANCHPDVSLPI